jgi:hypothetical protein
VNARRDNVIRRYVIVNCRARRTSLNDELSPAPYRQADAWKSTLGFRLFEGVRRMSFNGIADSEQLAMLTTVLDDYCQEAGLAPGTHARDRAGRVLMALYCNGSTTAQELPAALVASLAGESRRYG